MQAPPIRSACTGASTERSTVPSATRCSTAFAQRTWSATGFQAVRGSPAALRSATRCSSSSRSAGSRRASAGRAAAARPAARPRRASASCGSPVGTWRQIAIGIAEAYGICSAPVGSRLAAARAASAASASRSPKRRSGPGRSVERLERDDVARAALEEHALAPRPAAHVLPQRADEVGRCLRNVRARRRRDGRRTRRRCRSHSPSSPSTRITATSRSQSSSGFQPRIVPPSMPLAPVDGQLVGDRAGEAEPRRPQPTGRLAAADTRRSPTASA